MEAVGVQGGRPWESEVGGHGSLRWRPWESEVGGRGSLRWEAMGVQGGRPWESEVGSHGGGRSWESEVGGHGSPRWEAMGGCVQGSTTSLIGSDRSHDKMWEAVCMGGQIWEAMGGRGRPCGRPCSLIG